MPRNTGPGTRAFVASVMFLRQKRSGGSFSPPPLLKGRRLVLPSIHDRFRTAATGAR